MLAKAAARKAADKAADGTVQRLQPSAAGLCKTAGRGGVEQKPAAEPSAEGAKAAATKDAIEVKPKRTRRTKAQIEADMATKDASSDANSKRVAKKATTKRQRISRA